jgi:hypothetical protein
MLLLRSIFFLKVDDELDGWDQVIRFIARTKFYLI